MMMTMVMVMMTKPIIINVAIITFIIIFEGYVGEKSHPAYPAFIQN